MVRFEKEALAGMENHPILDEARQLLTEYNIVTNMTWEPRTTANEAEVDEMGSKLSLVICCPVRYWAHGKPLFECGCGVVFPLYVVKAGRWIEVARKHKDDRMLIGARI